MASIIAEVNRDPKKRSEPFTPADFMPAWGASEAPGEQTPEQMLILVEAFNAAMGGLDLRGEK